MFCLHFVLAPFTRDNTTKRKNENANTVFTRQHDVKNDQYLAYCDVYFVNVNYRIVYNYENTSTYVVYNLTLGEYIYILTFALISHLG